MNTQGYVTFGVALTAALGVHTLLFLSFSHDEAQESLARPLQLTLLSQAGGEHVASKHEPIQQQQEAKKLKSKPQTPRKTESLPPSKTEVKTKVKQGKAQTYQAKDATSSTGDSFQDEPRLEFSEREKSKRDDPKQANNQQAVASIIPQHVQQQILAKIIYPRQAKRRGLEGTAKFSLDIQQHAIQQATLLVSTGYQILDRAARKGIVSMQSLPLPDGTHLLPVTFRLH